jgi:DNA-binding MarR family transcriptional regulator
MPSRTVTARERPAPKAGARAAATPPAKRPRSAAAPKAGHGLERRVAYRFSLVANLSARALAGMYTRKFALTMADWKTLAIIGHFAPVYPGAIAERTSMLPEQVSRALDRLVTKGVVERSLDESDRRRVVVTLSARGRKAFDQIEAVRAAMEDDLLSELSKTERDALFRILDKLDHRAHALLEPADAWKRYAGSEAD